MAKKTSEAQIKASRRWEKKNRKKTTIDNYRRTAKLFIRNHADEKDLVELEDMINEKMKKIKDS